MAVIVKPPLAGFCVKSPFSSYRIRNTRIRSPHCCRSRLLPTVRRRVYPICWAKKGESTPPAPSSLLTKKDLKRIAKDGPSLRDIFQTETITVLDDKGNEIEKDVDFVPPGVLGNVTYNLEPNWWKLPRKSYMEFYRGLQERNWTSKIYNPNAEPWKIEFFRDSGRLLRPSFDGFRVLVEKADKSQFWVNLPTPGYPSFIEDLSAPRESRGVIQAPRSEPLTHINQYGYNQVFEQIFLAYEQRMPQQVREQYLKKGWVPRDTYVYDCPGAHLLDVSFQLTPPELSLFGLWDVIPSLAFAAFAFSFLAVCLAIGIFKPRKQMPTDAIQAIEFAQSKGRARRDGRTGVLFSDVAGLESILGDLEDIVKFLQDPEKYQELGVKPPKGVLLDGPPGTGKTLIAKAIAGEAGVPFYQMSGSEFVEAIVGVGAARVRDLFKRARAQEEACIIFVDEIDALGIKRADAGVETNEEREQTLNQLLTEMDGFTPDLGVVFIGATNRADLLDPALCRPGRFDRKLRLLKPNTESRLKILKVHAKNHPLDGDVDLEQLARDLPGLSGAELENVLNESALETIRRNGDTITSKDVYNAVERVLQGVRRPAQPNQLEIGKVMAIHEAGRAIMATLLREETGRLEAVERVSIIARGKDWTRTVFYRGKDEDYTMSTKARLLERVRVTLAGRAAEEVAVNTATSYGAKDLERAYLLIEKIVCNYGMSQLGITTYAPITRTKDFMRRSFEVSVDNIDEDLFGKGLKGGMFQPSDQGQHKLIMEIHALLKEAYEECMDILYRHSDALEAVAVALLERKELSGEEVSQIVHDNPPRQRKSVAQDRASLSARREREMISSANGGGESSDVKAAPGVANSEVKKPYVSLFSGLLRGESKYKDFDG